MRTNLYIPLTSSLMDLPPFFLFPQTFSLLMSTTIDPSNVSTAPSQESSSTSDKPSPSKVAQPKRKPKKKTLAGKIARSALMLIRKVHLYSGIFMFPFVLLYGFSGWFFNHPGYFRDGDTKTFAAADVADAKLTALPDAAKVAADVVDELNLESFMIDGPEVLLSEDQSPRFSGFLTYTVNADDATHSVTINPNDGSGEVKTVSVTETEGALEPPANPLAGIRSATIAKNPLEIGRDAVSDALKDLDLSSGEAFTGRRAPNVVFSVLADDVPCLVTYNLGSGSVTSIRQDARPTLGLKDQMRRMHLARMYSPQYDTRWVWALIVDAMFVSMVFWGISGLFMWWQVKRTRWIGGGVLVASLVFSAIMFVGMHHNLTEGSGRRGGGGGRGQATITRPDAGPTSSFAANTTQPKG